MSLVIGVKTDLPRNAWPIGAAFTFRTLVTSDGTSTGTPTNLTGRTYKFVLRKNKSGQPDNSAAGLVYSTTSITFTSVNGTSDAADVAILSTDAAIVPDTYHWGLWRTDNPSDRPEAYGTVGLVSVAAQ